MEAKKESQIKYWLSTFASAKTKSHTDKNSAPGDVVSVSVDSLPGTSLAAPVENQIRISFA